MVGNHRTITQTATDDLSRYGGVYASHAHPITHQATTIFSPTASVTASTGFVPSLGSPSKGEHIAPHGGSYPPTSLASCPPVTIKMSSGLQSRDSGSSPGSKKRSSAILEDKRKRKCWETEAGSSPKVAIATPTLKSAAKVTVPVALTSPTSRRTLSPVGGTELDQVTLSGTLPPHKSSTYPTVPNKKESGPGLSTTSSLRAIRPCKTSEPSTTLPLTSTTTSGIPVGIAVARQRSTSSHVAVTNTATTSYPDLNGLAVSHSLSGNNGLTATHSLSGNNGLQIPHSLAGNNGLSATHSLAGNIHTGTANGLHSVATATMGPGQCLPAMTLLTCDDGNNSSAAGWGSPWHYPMPMEPPMPQLSQSGNLQLVRDPNSGQFLLLPTASFDPMPGTVVWPAAPSGQSAPQLILPHPPHTHTTPLILDNRLLALSTPAPAPLSPTPGDKQRRGPTQATLVKLEDNSLTGVMMPSNDYSKATIGSDTNGYALIHHSPSFINPNFSAISSSSGSFLIQHISRNNNNNTPMQMSTAPNLFNNGGRTNNLLISTQQLPAGTQQLTLASPSGDMKDNIATICYDNLYHNTTTTTMFNLQQTTSVLNQQTTSTQQMSTTSILVNDKIGGGNSTFNVESQVDTCNTSSNYNSQIDMCNSNNEVSVGYSSNQMDSGNFTSTNANYNCDSQVENENSTGNEDSQMSAGTQDDEEEEEGEEEMTTKNDAGNQTDMPEEAKPDSDECSQDSSVQNDISDKPMSLNHGDENSLSENKDIDKNSLCEKNSVPDGAQGTLSTNETELSFKIDTRHVSITPIVKPTGNFSEKTKLSTCDNSTNDVTNDTRATISILDGDMNSNVSVYGQLSTKKVSTSPESKKKVKQMPSLYPIQRFLPNMKNEVNSAETKPLVFRSMPLLEDATAKEDSEIVTNNNVTDVKLIKKDKEIAAADNVADDTTLVVNALIGLGNNSREFKKNEVIKTDQHTCVKYNKEGSNVSTDLDGSDKDNHEKVRSAPSVFSVSNLLDKNFCSKNWTSTKSVELPEVTMSEKSDQPSQKSESSDISVGTEQSSRIYNSDCDSDGRDEILEVANILCSALFTSGSEKIQHRCSDADKASDIEERSSRKDSESSGTSCESGVDLSGLELLSNSIEQFERAKDVSGDFYEKGYHKEKLCVPEDDGVHSDETSHNDSGISRGLDLLCALAQERIQEESEVATSPQRRYDSSVWTPRRLTKNQDASSRWMMSSDTDDEMFVQPYQPRLYKRPPGVPYKEVSHTYRSLKSEQDTRRVLASKQTYHYAPPTSIDLKEMETRKLLAEIQREFREAQKELTRLTPKKSPHTPPEAAHGWRPTSCEAAHSGSLSGGKRKPGRPRKADKDVESLKHSGKKVRDMITDRSSSPSSAKHHKERIEPRTKLSVQMPSTPSHLNNPQAKNVEQSPPVLTPFSNSPLDMMECSRPPTLVKRQETNSSGVGGSYYRGRFLHDDDSEDSDQTEPPQLSPESAATCANRKRGRPPKKQTQCVPELSTTKKQPAPEPSVKRQFTPEPPAKRPSKPTFVSIVLANKNKQQAQKPSVWDDTMDYKPNKIRPKLKAEAKVKTTFSMPDSEDDVSDIEDSEPLSITVRKPSLAAGGTHVKISKPCEVDTFRKSNSHEPTETKKKDSSEVWPKNVCKKTTGLETDVGISGKLMKKAPSPETNVKKHKHSNESSKALNHETSYKKHKIGESEPSKTLNIHENSVKKHKHNESEPLKPPSNHETSAKKPKHNDSEASKALNNHEPSGKKHKNEGESCEQAAESRPLLPSVKRVKRAESGSSVGSAVSCGNTVPCETEQGDCKVTVEFLMQHEDSSTRVLVLNEGLLYAGQLTAISPPDIYGVQLDGERAHRPNIYSQEEVLKDVILEVKLSLSSVKPGKRMCAYWSQQYRCLYPGVVVSETSSRASGSPTFVNVEFDDGDSGSINVEDIRMLPQDFPLMTYADPLLTLGATTKRKRRNSSTSVEEMGPSREKIVRLDATIVEENEEEMVGNETTAPVVGDREKDEKVDATRGDKADGSDSSGKARSKSHKLKKRKRSREEKREHKKHKKHKHKHHRHKEKRRRSSSTELSNSGTSSVTEEHIKLAIKPIAEIVHKEVDDPLKITVKRDIICETHIVNETHVKEGGKVVTKVVESAPVDVNLEDIESNDSMQTEVEEKVDESLNGEDSVCGVNEDESEAESENINCLHDNHVDLKVKTEHNKVQLEDVNLIIEDIDKPEDAKVKEELHESLVLTISTSNACPKILHERKSVDSKDSQNKVKSQHDRCDTTDMTNNGKIDDFKPKKAKKSANTDNDNEKHALEGKSNKKKQASDEMLRGEKKIQKKKTSKAKEQEKQSCGANIINVEEQPTGARESIEKEESKPNTSPLKTTTPNTSDISPRDKTTSHSEQLDPPGEVESSSSNNNKPSSSKSDKLSSSSTTHTPSAVSKLDKPSTNAKSDKPSTTSKLDSHSITATSEPSSSKCTSDSPARGKRPKAKPSKEREASVDSKSSMTHFLPEKQLWDWAGTSYKRCTTKRKGRKLFYKSIQRGEESLSVGDCAVFLSTETDQPYIGKIDGFWESYASMNVKVKWFYHPEETVGCPLTLPCYQGALFEACHFDENDIQTISHKCHVLPLPDYQAKLSATNDPTDLYYLAGLYDHINRKIQFEPGVDPTGAQTTVSN